METKIRLGVSACLLGENVRFDGGHKLDRFLTDTLGQFVEYVPVCPEVGCGLPVPRDPTMKFLPHKGFDFRQMRKLFERDFQIEREVPADDERCPHESRGRRRRSGGPPPFFT